MQRLKSYDSPKMTTADEARVVSALMDAWATGDMESILTFYAKDAVLTVDYPGHPEWSSTHSGQDEIRALIEYALSVNHTNRYEIVSAEEGTVTTALEFYNDALQHYGLVPAHLTDVSVVRNGKVVSEVATVSPESVAQRERAEAAESTVLALANAINDKDLEGAVALFSPAAVYRTLNWPVEPVFSGKEELRAWLADLIAQDYEIEPTITQSNGRHVIGHDALQWAFTRRHGLQPIVGKDAAVVQDGLITEFTWTATDESRTRFEGAVKREAKKALVQRLVHAFNVGELAIIDEIVAPDFVMHNPLVPEGIHGSDGLKTFFASAIAAMPDVFHPMEHLIGEGDLVAVHLPLTGTFVNEMNGIPPTDKLVRTTFINIWRVIDDQIVEAWFSFDTFGYLQQLGVIPREEAPARQLTDEEAGNLAVYTRIAEEVYNQGNKETIRELYAPDMIAYMPGDLILYGHEGVDLFVDLTFGAFPDMYWVLDDVLPAGDTIAVRVTGYGTFTNTYLGIPPNGKRIKWPLLILWRFADGKAVEARGFYDQLAFMQQLGAIPAEPLNIDPEVTRAVAWRIVESWNADSRNYKEIKDEIISPFWALHPQGQPDLVELFGREGFSGWITGFVTSFPDLTYTIDTMIVEGELAAVRWTGTSTHTVEFMGIPPTGKEVIVTGTNIYRVVDGQNTDIWYTFDTMGFMQQLGVVPASE